MNVEIASREGGEHNATEIWKEGTEYSEKRDAPQEKRHSQKRVWEESNEQKAGNCDRIIGSQRKRRESTEKIETTSVNEKPLRMKRFFIEPIGDKDRYFFQSNNF